MIKLKCIRKTGTYNWVKFGQIVNVEEKNVDEYLKNWFIVVEAKKEEKKTAKNTKKTLKSKKKKKWE